MRAGAEELIARGQRALSCGFGVVHGIKGSFLSGVAHLFSHYLAH